MKNIFIVILISIMSYLGLAQTGSNQTFVRASVGSAGKALQKIVTDGEMASGLSAIEKNISEKLLELIQDDFLTYKHKYEGGKSRSKICSFSESCSYSTLNKKNIDIYIQGFFYKKGNGTYIKVKASNVLAKKKVYEDEKLFTMTNWRDIAHDISDRVYRELNEGKRSIFKDKIVFVSNLSNKLGHQIKELYIADFDGERKKALTSHGGVVISPAVSPDGKRILYSLIDSKKRRKNIDLMMLDLRTNKVSLISSKKGINSGAVFTGDGKSILLTLSFNGNADIFEMRLDSKELTQITDNRAADVDPAINGKGTQMSFLSDRSGKAMIYSLDLSRPGAKPVRISYVGKFNATPRYSVGGEDIVFSSWLDNGFDIFRIKSTGDELVRLTKDFGSNEEPSFSLDDEFIIFSSRRVISSKRAKDSIYLMTKDGEIIKEVIKNFGSATTPRWLR